MHREFRGLEGGGRIGKRSKCHFFENFNQFMDHGVRRPNYTVIEYSQTSRAQPQILPCSPSTSALFFPLLRARELGTIIIIM